MSLSPRWNRFPLTVGLPPPPTGAASFFYRQRAWTGLDGDVVPAKRDRHDVAWLALHRQGLEMGACAPPVSTRRRPLSRRRGDDPAGNSRVFLTPRSRPGMTIAQSLAWFRKAHPRGIAASVPVSRVVAAGDATSKTWMSCARVGTWMS